MRGEAPPLELERDKFLRRRHTNLLNRSVSPICHHVRQANTRRSMMGTIPGDTPFGGDPDIPVSILNDILDRIVRQSVSLAQVLEHPVVIPTDTSTKRPEPEMTFPILENAVNPIMS